MSQKKPASMRLQNTLNELETSIEQWDSLTNKPQGEQVSEESDVQKKAKSLLKELRDQINDFETLSDEGETQEPERP